MLGIWIEQTEGAKFWLKVFNDLKTRGGAGWLCRRPLGAKYSTIVQSWRRAWEHLIPFFAFPPEVRRVIYTTNVIESLHMQLRKIIKTRGHFPSDEAATKLLWWRFEISSPAR